MRVVYDNSAWYLTKDEEISDREPVRIFPVSLYGWKVEGGRG